VKNRRRLGLHAAQALVHLAGLVPLAVLARDAATDNLTVNPIQRITFWTGKWALVFLVLSLACTPASSVFGFRPALRWRRPLGLYSFMYALLHFVTFVGLDYGFDVGLLREAIFEKRYALVGFSAFMLLLPLAITSTRGWMRRLGKRWKLLHRAVYLVALLVIVHYVWLVKSDIQVPLTYAAILLFLLVLRLPPVRHALRSLIDGTPHGQALPGTKTRRQLASSSTSQPIEPTDG
jgi:sulfoxide reductase heme-binding subunit YedZ